jgi:hypothetical protein
MQAQDKQTTHDIHAPGQPARQASNDKGPPCGGPLHDPDAGRLLSRETGKTDAGARFAVLTEKGYVMVI